MGEHQGVDVGPGQKALRALLGRTRADLLAAIAAGGGSTGEPARRLAVSPAAVSQHTAALRDSGLIVTRRRGQGVHHCAPPLGNALLSGNRRIPHADGGRFASAPSTAQVPSQESAADGEGSCRHRRRPLGSDSFPWTMLLLLLPVLAVVVLARSHGFPARRAAAQGAGRSSNAAVTGAVGRPSP